MSIKVETFRSGLGVDCMKLTGFSERELSELNSMDYREMKSTIIAVLDNRNNGLGTQWAEKRSLYNAWIREGAVFVEIGKEH